MKLTIIFRWNLVVCLLITFSFIIPFTIHHLLPETSVNGRILCRILSIMLLAGGTIAFLACYGRNSYFDSMVVEAPAEEPADSRYIPFAKGNVLCSLEETSHLRLHKDLPVLEGSATMLPFYASMAEMIYGEEIADLPVEESPFQYIKDGDPYLRLVKGQADMIFTEEKASAEALTELHKRKLTLNRKKIGEVAFVFFVNSRNPVNNLTLSQIRSIYADGINNWGKLGGEDEPILPFQCEANPSAQAYLQEILGRVPAKESIQIFQLSSEEGLSETSLTYMNAAGALGCTYNCFLRGLEVEKGIKVLKVEGTSPAVDDNAWLSYSLKQPVYCVTIEERKDSQTDLVLDWIKSDQGRRLMLEAGYYPFSGEEE